jgi:DNA-binding beta-propeller fold protein YncE
MDRMDGVTMRKLLRVLCGLGLAASLLPVGCAEEREAAPAEQAPPAHPEEQAAQAPPPPAASEEIVKKGLRVAFSAAPARKGLAQITHGEFAEVRFRVTDAETGAPVSPLEPAVWISRVGGALEELSCRDRIGRYVQGLISFQADVDLNKYFILILNNDQTISIVDPLMGVSGITQLYGMIVMESRGEDWARSADDKRLYVTLPKVGKVAVVDLEDFEVSEEIAAGSRPVRIVLQPDGKYLWVGNDGRKEQSGVTVIDARSHQVVAYLPTGRGHHEIAFSDDSLLAFVTNAQSETVSIIDVEKLEKLKDLPTGSPAVDVAFSGLGGVAYVATRDGGVAVVDPKRRELRSRIETGAGLAAFRLDPSGRWGFVANAEQNRVDVLDASNGKIAHRLQVGEGPHQFAFTATYAYVRHLGTADVTLVPLSQLSVKATPGIQVVPLGTRAPGEYAFPAEADSISPTGEWTAVVASNPADKMVYYYMEGMIAPMGSYSTYGRIPRAVGVVDRSVRETEKGVYSAKFRVPESGEYVVSLLIDSPLVDHCFSFTSASNPALAEAGKGGPPEIEFLNQERRVPVGAPMQLRFALTHPGSDDPVSGLEDVMVLATRPPGIWQERIKASPLEEGLYQVDLVPEQPGAYYVAVAVPSLDVDYTEMRFMTFLAVDGEASGKEK